jgi:hypothetical protein
MTRHIRADKLAGYQAGDLGARESARVRAHLDGCARCRAAADDLAAVSTVLASVPAPPMPADVTARIEAALAAEAASRAVSPAAPAARGPVPAASGGDTATRRATARRSEEWSGGWLRSPVTLRVATGAAVAVVVLGGSFAAIRLAGSPGSSGQAASSGSQAGPAAGAGAAHSSNEAAPALAPAPSLSYQAGGQAKPFTVLASSGNLGPGNLVREVSGLLLSSQSQPASSASPVASPAPSGQRSAPGARTADGRIRGIAGFAPATLEACVTRVADGGSVRLVETSRYQGQKALVIVVAPAGGGPSRIWVVGTGCSATASDVIARMALPGAG